MIYGKMNYYHMKRQLTKVYPNNIVSLNDYKRKKGIALSRSPYSTLDATEVDVHEAYLRAAELMNEDTNMYAAVIGYENIKNGKIKLLKGLRLYSSRGILESTAGINGHKCLVLVRKG